MRTLAARLSLFAGMAALCVSIGCPAPRTDKLKAVDAGPDAGIEKNIDSGIDAGVDAGIDSGVDAGVDAGIDAGPMDAGMCPAVPTEGYTCDPSDASTCPGGWCIVSWCVGQVVDAGGLYSTCGDGVCEPCETAEECPADCAPAPVTTGSKSYTDPNTISIWVHGFTPHSSTELSSTTFGAVTGCSDLGAALNIYEPDLPCTTGETDTRPNQIDGIEYYGAVPPDWMQQSDIDEVEQYPYDGPQALQRYGLILAKFINYRLAKTGADYVNLACHSMGCEISRYVIENDIEGVASSQKIVRWETNAGVVAGARLARLYDNPDEQMYAALIQSLISTSDFLIMDPLYMQENVAVYDHQLWEGNNPLFSGILIHHMTGSDPYLPQAENLDLLDVIPSENPGDEPNDGIMFTSDEYFHSQADDAAVKTPSGQYLSASHTFVYTDHMDVPSDTGSYALMAAALFHQRRVIVSLQSITLNTDFEIHQDDISTWFPLQDGTPPAEVVASVQADYSPYTMPKYGVTALVDNDQIVYRTAQMFQQAETTMLTPDMVLFQAPVFDDQTDFDLTVDLTESDFYPVMGLEEFETPIVILPSGEQGHTYDRAIISYSGDVTLTNQTIPVMNGNATINLQVQVVPLY